MRFDVPFVPYVPVVCVLRELNASANECGKENFMHSMTTKDSITGAERKKSLMK